MLSVRHPYLFLILLMFASMIPTACAPANEATPAPVTMEYPATCENGTFSLKVPQGKYIIETRSCTNNVATWQLEYNEDFAYGLTASIDENGTVSVTDYVDDCPFSEDIEGVDIHKVCDLIAGVSIDAQFTFTQQATELPADEPTEIPITETPALLFRGDITCDYTARDGKTVLVTAFVYTVENASISCAPPTAEYVESLVHIVTDNHDVSVSISYWPDDNMVGCVYKTQEVGMSTSCFIDTNQGEAFESTAAITLNEPFDVVMNISTGIEVLFTASVQAAP
jgi:hypothetical protein